MNPTLSTIQSRFIAKFSLGLGAGRALENASGLRRAHLPGDISVEKKNVRFYFPVVSCIVISLLLTGISYLIRAFGGSK